MIRFAMQGNFSEAQEINLRLFDLHKWLYIDGNPAGVKAGAHYLGLCENIFRLPLVQMTLGNFDRLKRDGFDKLINIDLNLISHMAIFSSSFTLDYLFRCTLVL